MAFIGGQRVPATATFAVLPEAEDVDNDLKPEDLRIEVCRSGGPGGQGVNTTDSALQAADLQERLQESALTA